MAERLIFISHAPEQVGLAAAIVQALSARRVTGWARPLADPATGMLDQASMRAMERAETVLLLLSRDAAASERIERELIVAVQLSRPMAVADIDGAAGGRLDPHIARARRLGRVAEAEAIAQAVAGTPVAGGGGRGLKIGILIGAIVLLFALITAAILFWPRSSPSLNAVTGTNGAPPAAPQATDPTRDADRDAARRDREARAPSEEEPVVREDEPPPVAPPSYAGDTTPARLVGGTISDADYPAPALRAGEEGRVTMQYVVGTDGRVSGCSVTESSGSATLDSTSCSLLTRRFRYAPATRNGRPVAETRTQRIAWRLPSD